MVIWYFQLNIKCSYIFILYISICFNNKKIGVNVLSVYTITHRYHCYTLTLMANMHTYGS